MHSTSTALRFGILGTAKIARAFIAGVRGSETVTAAAVASRNLSTAREYADKTGIAAAYGTYEELLGAHDLDAVYIPLPNGLHAEWAIRALEAGKHVLCEKPLASTAAEARAMFAAAQAKRRVLAEAFPYRAQPHWQRFMEIVGGGALGRIRSVQAAFGFTMTDPANIRFDPALSGGALMDGGVYPVSLVRAVAGERPARVSAAARWHAGGVDQSLSATLEHPGGLLAQISCSFETAVHRHALIAGSAGALQTDYPNNPPPGRGVTLLVKRGPGGDVPYESEVLPGVDGFRAEAESFARAVRSGMDQWTGASAAESIDIAATLEAILSSARRGQAVEVGG